MRLRACRPNCDTIAKSCSRLDFNYLFLDYSKDFLISDGINECDWMVEQGKNSTIALCLSALRTSVTEKASKGSKQLQS